MKISCVLFAFCFLSGSLFAQDPAGWLATLPQAKDYAQHRVSSYDRSGGNGDARAIAPGETLTLLDEAGPGMITHVWVTIASDDPHHLKALVLRMYWDGEAAPSVEAPIGDFFGLGLGDYEQVWVWGGRRSSGPRGCCSPRPSRPSVGFRWHRGSGSG